MKLGVTASVNGVRFNGDIEPRMLLVDFLRTRVGLKSPHIGCDTGHCGACTVIVNGRLVKSCMMLGVQADGAEILTVEGLASGGTLHPLQSAFSETHALQCGYCTPGFIMAAYSLLTDNMSPSDGEIRAGLAGNLCMCTGYVNIIKAVRLAAEKMKGDNQSVKAP